jgi:hypothetical protein
MAASLCFSDKLSPMKKIVGYLKEYIAETDKRVGFLSLLFVGALIFCNYYFGLNRFIVRLSYPMQYLLWFAIFFSAFFVGYWLQTAVKKTSQFRQKNFLALLVLAPAIFAWKMMFPLHLTLFTDVFRNQYWNAVLYWPFKVFVVTLMLWIVHRLFSNEEPFYGVTMKNFLARPYLVMLLLMMPLVAVASTQPDFLRMYPRIQQLLYLSQPDRGWHRLLYELSYGSDFFAIELFFRGFLVLAFARYAGKDAILPMAIFYCAIHFGKPLGECISSFFGGIILGVVCYHTRTIMGGFFVHVGLAWMMELGGYLGRLSS